MGNKDHVGNTTTVENTDHMDNIDHWTSNRQDTVLGSQGAEGTPHWSRPNQGQTLPVRTALTLGCGRAVGGVSGQLEP